LRYQRRYQWLSRNLQPCLSFYRFRRLRFKARRCFLASTDILRLCAIYNWENLRCSGTFSHTKKTARQGGYGAGWGNPAGKAHTGQRGGEKRGKSEKRYTARAKTRKPNVGWLSAKRQSVPVIFVNSLYITSYIKLLIAFWPTATRWSIDKWILFHHHRFFLEFTVRNPFTPTFSAVCARICASLRVSARPGRFWKLYEQKENGQEFLRKLLTDIDLFYADLT
jgi:hypothetical protein